MGYLTGGQWGIEFFEGVANQQRKKKTKRRGESGKESPKERKMEPRTQGGKIESTRNSI